MKRCIKCMGCITDQQMDDNNTSKSNNDDISRIRLSESSSDWDEYYNPLKSGYERIYTDSGSYYDQPILKDKEIRCAGCHCGYFKKKLKSDNGLTNLMVCQKCLDNKIIIHCKNCKKFMYNLRFLSGPSGYCLDCEPPITFIMDIKKPYNQTIDINIQINKHASVAHSYLFYKLAKKLNIPVDRIKINNSYYHSYPNGTWYPSEFRNLSQKERTYVVEIVN